MGVYTFHNIKINTDINQLLSDKLPWRQSEKRLDQAFPQKIDNLVIIIDGKTGATADAAAAALSGKLQEQSALFPFVSRPDALPFFRANGLLYLSETELADTLDQIAQSQPLIAAMVTDPSLRGFFGTIGLMLQGAQSGAAQGLQIDRPLNAITQTIDDTLAGKDHPLDLQQLMPQSQAEGARDLRKFIITKPTLDYSSLQPGEKATQAVKQAAQDLGLTPDNGITVRLTGPVPLNDEEFASVADGTGTATALSGLCVIFLLFMAMRTWRIVIPIALTLCAGLIASTFFATVAVGSLNLISVAFAVMFIGIAVDFGIQFGVRYRDQHHLYPHHAQSLKATAQVIAIPLAMAAASTALGFLSFIPTSYLGVSELGLIAGVGMIIAFFLNITLLPALMTLTKPPSEAESIGYVGLTPLNSFLLTKRKILLPCFILIVLAGLIIASHVGFDFDPLDLKNPQSASVMAMFDVMKDPDSDAYAADLLVPSEQIAQERAAELAKLPEVDHVMSLNSFIPEDQDKKLSMITDTATILAPTFSLPRQPSATDQDNIAAMTKMAALLHMAGDQMPAAKNLADALNKCIVNASPDLLMRLQKNLLSPMQSKLAEVQNIVQTHPVTLNDIPPEIKRDWVTANGQWLLEIFPKRGSDNNPRDPKNLTRFIDAVQKAAPDVTGTPVSIRESGRTIISAFVHAGIYGLCSIALLSFFALRRWRDVLIMLTPLVIAGILTLATITLMGIKLNFANIIALPLLFSLGVSYAVYFVFYAQMGHKTFLQSSMARAVLFSAGTVLVAFCSLCFSSHPGTRGMGELLTIALSYSLLCTFFMLPVLLGSPGKDTP